MEWIMCSCTSRSWRRDVVAVLCVVVALILFGRE